MTIRGTRLYASGMVRSEMGIAASSERIIAVINSEICICPSCRLPIMRMNKRTTAYIKIVRNSTVIVKIARFLRVFLWLVCQTKRRNMRRPCRRTGRKAQNVKNNFFEKNQKNIEKPLDKKKSLWYSIRAVSKSRQQSDFEN